MQILYHLSLLEGRPIGLYDGSYSGTSAALFSNLDVHAPLFRKHMRGAHEVVAQSGLVWAVPITD